MDLFVYGTLLRGFERHRYLGGARALGPAVLPQARLTERTSARFPFLHRVDDAHVFVLGERYEVDPTTLRELDAIEGFEPERPDDGLFLRRRLEVRDLATGRSCSVEVYLAGPGQEGDRPLDTGDYRRHRQGLDQGEPVWVLAYGSNLDPDQLQERIGPVARIAPVRLTGWRLAFTKGSHTGGAYLNLEFTGGPEEAPAAALALTAAQADRLDGFEGVSKRHYIRAALDHATPDGGAATFAWLAHPDRIVTPRPPTENYLGHVRAGYAHFGFDPDPLEDALDRARSGSSHRTD